MNIAVESYELYNNNILVGKWFNTEEDSIEDVYEYIKEIHRDNGFNDSDLELFVADYEDEYNIYSGESLEKAYEISEAIENLDDCDKEAVRLLIDNNIANDIFDAIDKKDDLLYTDETDMGAVAENYIIETGALSDMPENLRYYFDYEALGRDMEIGGTYLEGKDGVIWEYIG